MAYEEPPRERETRVVERDGNNMGIILIIIVLVIIFFLFFVFGGNFRGGGTQNGGDVTIPVPDQVDVNVNNDAGSE